MKSKRFFMPVVILAVVLLFTSVTAFAGCNTSTAIALKKLSGSSFALITDGSYKNDVDDYEYYHDFSSVFSYGTLEIDIENTTPRLFFNANFDSSKYNIYKNMKENRTSVYKISEEHFSLNNCYLSYSYDDKDITIFYFGENNFGSGSAWAEIVYFKEANIIKLTFRLYLQLAEFNTDDVNSIDNNSFYNTYVSANLLFRLIEKTDGTIRIGEGGGGNNNPPVGDSKYKTIQNAYKNAGYEIDPSWINESGSGDAYIALKNMYSAMGYELCFISKDFGTLNSEVYMLMDVGSASVAEETAQSFGAVCRQRDRYIIISYGLKTNYGPFDSALIN